MDTNAKLNRRRAGYKGSITRTLESAETCQDRQVLQQYLTSISDRLAIIKAIDDQMLDNLEEDDDIEGFIMDIEEYSFNVRLECSKLQLRSQSIGQPEPPATTLASPIGQPEPPATTLASPIGQPGPPATTLASPTGQRGPPAATSASSIGQPGPPATTLATPFDQPRITSPQTRSGITSIENHVSTQPLPFHSDLGASRSIGAQNNFSYSDFDPFAPRPQAISQVSPPITDSSISNATNVRLARMDLPTFTGDPTKWQEFWDSYSPAIHLNRSIPLAEKFSRLRGLLRDKAAKVIAGFATTAANYQRALELLFERYGQTHEISQAHMQAIVDLPIPTNDFDSLQEFYDQTESHIRGLEALGHSQDQYGTLLAPLIINKLPEDVRQPMTRTNGGSDWTLPAIRSLFKKELDVRRKSSSSSGQNFAMTFATPTTNPPQRKSGTFRTPIGRPNPHPPSCIYCDDKHPPHQCRRVTDVTRRKQIVTEKRLCFNCLSSQHGVRNCPSRFRCRKCKGKHHSSICSPPPTSSSNLSQVVSEPSNDATTPPSNEGSTNLGMIKQLQQTLDRDGTIMTAPSDAKGVLLSTSVTPVTVNGTTAEANILFDLGAQRSFVSEDFLKRLEVTPQAHEAIMMSGIECSSSTYRKLPKIDIHIQSRNDDPIPVSALVLKTIAAPISIKNRDVKRLPYLRKLPLAHPVPADGPFVVDILIAADAYWKIVEDETVRGDGPTAIKSKVGYLLSGPLSPTTAILTAPPQVHGMMTVVSDVDDCRDTLKDLEQFWTMESIGIVPETRESTPDAEFRANYQRTSLELKDGKYVAKLPWKDEFPEVPSNYAVTDRRMRRMTQRLTGDTIKIYDNILKEQENRRFIEKVAPEHMDSTNRIHYIPHHPVVKDSATTPFRVVYDCSCRISRNHASLNDCLQSIPPVYNDIPEIMCRFRLKEHAVIADIEKAFLNVTLHPDDRDVTRFFWLSDISDPNSPWDTYRFKSVLFGATCSPFILDATIRKHLDGNTDPTASHILQGLYVDNVVNSFDSKAETIDYFHKSRALMDSAGFNLRSWKSSYAPLNDLAAEHGVLDTNPSPKVLGLVWDPLNDTLTFPPYQHTQLEMMTKREAVSAIAKIYDPLGILGPVVVRAKIFLQKLWKIEKLGWDDPIPDELQKEWKSLETDLDTATSMKFSRKIDRNSELGQESTLHIFVDSSQQAYGASAYLVTGNESEFIIARNRVAPIKTLTLPRLELMAAVLGSRLYDKLKRVLQPMKTYLWSDSQIVLSWIMSNKKLDVFTRNRVSEINRLTEGCEFHFCPTAFNPADLLTRGLSARTFVENRLWKHGPSWITDTDSWPTSRALSVTQMIIAADACEVDEPKPATDTLASIPIINKLVHESSDPIHLLRVISRIYRFIKNTRTAPDSVQGGGILPSELRTAEKIVLRTVQGESFHAEINALKAKKSTTLCRQLRLFLDDEQILRSGGRIHNANLSQDAKFPILLPSHHPYSTAMIKLAHKDAMHLGLQSTITALRQRFWIPKAGQVVKSVLRNCVPCRKHHGRPFPAPISPPLPKIRVQDAPPFAVTGLDFSGALPIRTSTGTRRVYILLLTCAITRSIHLEALLDMTTEGLLLALRRFMARRGTPSIFISDNALYFQAADRRIQSILQSSEFQHYMTNQKIEWRFIPKRAPWFGGFWERLVGLVKGCVQRVLGRNPVSYEMFFTLLTEIEATLNNRPLTRASSDVNDLDPLTPSDLLHGRRLHTIPLELDDDGDATYGPNALRRRHDDRTRQMDDAWKRFRTEYLTSLRQYHATTGHSLHTIAVGDVVQVHHEGPRNTWKLAIVETLHYGCDGQVRSAAIRTAQGRTNRPISKLYPLEVRAVTSPVASSPVPIPVPTRPRRQAAEQALQKIHLLHLNDDSSDEE